MEAGLISFRLCDQDFDCDHCLLNRAMRGEQSESAPLLGSRKLEGPAFLPSFEYIDHHFYSENHLWGRVEARGLVRLGLDDFARQLLGPVFAVVLPEENSQLDDQLSCQMISQAGRIAIQFPLAGRVAWTNSQLAARPGLVNAAPYAEGSLLLVEPQDLVGYLDGAKFGEEAAAWFREEIRELAGEITRLSSDLPFEGETAQDGGHPLPDLLSVFRREKTFLPVIRHFLSKKNTPPGRR